MIRTFILGIATAMFCLAGLSPGTSIAEPSSSQKLMMKAAVVKHINDHTKDGTYYFVSSESTDLMELKFVAMHPVVFERPDGVYALCADFETASKTKVLVDYYLRELEGKFVVLSSIEGKRSLLMGIAERFGL